MSFRGEYPVLKILSALEADDLLPAIVFRTSRKQCDADIRGMARARYSLLPHSEQRGLRQEIEKIIEQYEMPRDLIHDHPQYMALVATGAGAHHAGQLLMWRLLLEELMSRGKLRLMIATGTVAAGVDFPARSVVITAHSKRGSEGFDILSSAEFQQMSGRAGRRGKDSVGFCVVAPSAFADARVLYEVSKRPPEPLRSAYFASPSTVLNLLKHRSVEELRYTVSKSLASFLDAKAATGLEEEARRVAETAETEAVSDRKKRTEKKARRMTHEAETLRNKQQKQLEETLQVLEKLGHLEEGKLTSKGYWSAELCTSLVLELSEAVARGLFEDLSVYELVALVASIAGDPHRRYFNLSHNPIKKDLYKKLAVVLEDVKKIYSHPGNSEVAVVPDAGLTVISWMDAEGWQEYSSLLRLANVADGDATRLISQTADHLNQLSRLQESHPELARLAKEGREKVLKPPLTEAVYA